MTGGTAPEQPAPPPPSRPPTRTLWSDLRGIDSSIVPRLVARVRRFHRGLQDFGPTVDRGRGGAAATLTRLDRRYARRGVLGLVRDVPQAGAFALAVLITLAAVLVLVRAGHSSGNTGETDELPVVLGPHTVTVGPYAFDTTNSYLQAARTRLTTRTATAPTEPVYAIADFGPAVTPDDATSALPGVVPALVFLHVQAPASSRCNPTQARRVTSLPDGANIEFTKLASCLQSEAVDLARQAATTTDTAAATSYRADAGRERAAARALRGSCACIVAVVVRASASELALIANSGRVRVIDPAEPGQRLRDICWVPLYQHATGVSQQLCGATGAAPRP